MRVVSQNRDFSFEFENTVSWMQDCYIYAKVDMTSQLIGKYKSEQRAREVFMNMHNKYEEITRPEHVLDSKVFCLPED